MEVRTPCYVVFRIRIRITFYLCALIFQCAIFTIQPIQQLRTLVNLNSLINVSNGFYMALL